MEAVTAPIYSNVETLEKRFNILQDITDQVALINSPYDSDLEGSFQTMEGFTVEARGWDLDTMEPEILRVYMSHMSFHREIVAEIIAEARRQLMDDRRDLVKRLVNYHKEFSRWYLRTEKKFL